MQIDENILITYGGVAKKYAKGAYIFWEGDMPYYYFQIMEGEVEMYTTNESDKELTQDIFCSGQSFGEPPLLLNCPYPGTARVLKNATVIRLRSEFFLNMLRDFPEINTTLLYTFARRIYNKAISTQIWLARTPEEKLSLLLSRLKERNQICNELPVPYTRQQLAKLTGLRTETVIRTLKRMCEEGKIVIRNHKLYCC